MKSLVLVNLNASGDLVPDWTQSHPENEVANVNSWHASQQQGQKVRDVGMVFQVK